MNREQQPQTAVGTCADVDEEASYRHLASDSEIKRQTNPVHVEDDAIGVDQDVPMNVDTCLMHQLQSTNQRAIVDSAAVLMCCVRCCWCELWWRNLKEIVLKRLVLK